MAVGKLQYALYAAGAALLALIVILSFVSVSKKPGLVVENATLSGTLHAEGPFSFSLENADLRISSEAILLKTGGRSINATGSLILQDADGTVSWTGHKFVLEGTLDSAQGNSLSITWTQHEKTTAVFSEGTIDATKLRLPELKRNYAGSILLGGLWRLQLNQTPFKIKDFEGRLYLSHFGNDTTLTIDGRTKKLEIECKNILQLAS